MPGPYDTLLAIRMDEADMSTLRVAGASLTYRSAFRPPDDLSGNFAVLARFDGEHIDVDSFLTLWYPAGGDKSYPYTAGGYEFQNPKSSVESPARRGPRMPLRGAGSSVPPECNVPWPGIRTSSGAWRHSPDLSMEGCVKGFVG